MKNIFALYLLLFSIITWSQKTNQEFHFVNIKEGISKVGVSKIIQDHYGFIWIGTTGTGLYKFDGIDFTSYKHKLKDSTSLSNNRITSLFLDIQNVCCVI